MWWIIVVVLLIVLAVLVAWVSRLPRGSSKSDRFTSQQEIDRNNPYGHHRDGGSGFDSGFDGG